MLLNVIISQHQLSCVTSIETIPSQSLVRACSEEEDGGEKRHKDQWKTHSLLELKIK